MSEIWKNCLDKLQLLRERILLKKVMPPFPKGVEFLNCAEVLRRSRRKDPVPPSEGHYRLLVVLANHGIDQLCYLEQVIREFQSYDPHRYTVHVVVHSNVDIDQPWIGDCEIAISQPENPHMLPSSCRRTFYQRRDDYDLFLYSENDQLYRQKSIDAFLEVTQILPADKVAGFFQYEETTGSDIRCYPAYFGKFQWLPDSVCQHGGHTFAQFSNIHHAGFLLTRQQLRRCVESMDFLTIKGPCSLKCSVGTNPYEYCGMTKLICVSAFEDFLIHHLPNKYAKKEMKTFDIKDDTQMQRDLATLLAG